MPFNSTSNYIFMKHSSNFFRRDFFKFMGVGIASLAIPGKLFSQKKAEPLPVGSTGLLNITDFGAKADGVTDNTNAIQGAIDAAAKTGATVLIPPGTFLTSTLKLYPQVGLLGYPTWSYRSYGGSILRLNNENAKCLIDITGAYGTTINGLCIDGAGLGKDIHGILLDKPDFGRQEDTPLIERCRIGNFSGDAVHLEKVWCFRIRSCMLSHCGGNGLYVMGWDGFILDNWLSGNRGMGFASTVGSASVTLTGNRIEWNRSGGIACYNANNYNITGNNIDRSGGPAICLMKNTYAFAITGNMINRSGKPEWTSSDDKDSTHVRIENCSGIALVGNAFRAGADDGERGEYSPANGIVYSNLRNSVIKDNTMHNGALKKLLLDLGNNQNVAINDNIGQLWDIKDI